MDLQKSNLKEGDCLGLSPVTFGTVGPYVTSDLQFAQKTQLKMREYGREFGRIEGHKILEDTAMALAMRFQVSEDGKTVENSEMIV